MHMSALGYFILYPEVMIDRLMIAAHHAFFKKKIKIEGLLFFCQEVPHLAEETMSF